MSFPHRFLPEFFRDVEEAVAWYDSQEPVAADRFHLQISVTLDSLIASPQSNPIVDHFTRVAIVGDFPYGIYFRTVEDEIVIVELWHLSRKPGLWRRRK